MVEKTANVLGALSLAVADRIEEVGRAVLGRSGETPAAVVVIGYGAGLTNDRLRRILRLSHPGTVRLVDRLVADGLVERRPGRDSREIALHLTGEGERMRARLLEQRLTAIGDLLAVLSEGEQQQLHALLTAILARRETSELDRFTLCRLCDDRVCTECPLPTEKPRLRSPAESA